MRTDTRNSVIGTATFIVVLILDAYLKMQGYSFSDLAVMDISLGICIGLIVLFFRIELPGWFGGSDD